jgi:Ca2+/Na+ antiporter
LIEIFWWVLIEKDISFLFFVFLAGSKIKKNNNNKNKKKKKKKKSDVLSFFFFFFYFFFLFFIISAISDAFTTLIRFILDTRL